jgi:hypothetical protein
MKTYKHTQRGTLILVVMSIMSVIFVAIGLIVCKPVLIGVPLLLVCGWRFHSLTIEITDGELRWQFGSGLIRKRVPLHDIASTRPVRTMVCEGWGIHLSRFGWLYNVSGFDAVAITLRNGKRFALGTDEPDKLAASLTLPARARP